MMITSPSYENISCCFVIHYPKTRRQLIKTQSFSKTEALNEIKIYQDKAKYTHPDFRYALTDPQCSIPRGIPIRP